MHPCSFWRNERRLDRLFLSCCSKIPCMQTADYAYELPESAIAVHPVMPRSSARLLTWRQGAVTTDLRFTDLPAVACRHAVVGKQHPGHPGAFVAAETDGGRLEVFLLEPHEMSMEQALASTESVVWKCMVKGGSGGQLVKRVEREDAAGSGGQRQTRGHGRGCALHRIEVDAPFGVAR